MESCFVGEEEELEVGGGSSDWSCYVNESPEEGGVLSVLPSRISMEEMKWFAEVSSKPPVVIMGKRRRWDNDRRSSR